MLNFKLRFNHLLTLFLIIHFVTVLTVTIYFNFGVLETLNSLQDIMRNINNSYLVLNVYFSVAIMLLLLFTCVISTFLKYKTATWVIFVYKFLSLSIFKKICIIHITLYLYITLILCYMLFNESYNDLLNETFLSLCGSSRIGIYSGIGLILFKPIVVLHIYFGISYSIFYTKFLISVLHLLTLFIVITNGFTNKNNNITIRSMLFKLIGLTVFIVKNKKLFIFMIVSNIFALLIIRNIYCLIFPFDFTQYKSVFDIIHLVLSTYLIMSIIMHHINNKLLYTYGLIDEKIKFDINNLNFKTLLVYTSILFFSINYISPFLRSIAITLMPHFVNISGSVIEQIKHYFAKINYNKGWPPKFKNNKDPNWDDIYSKYHDEDKDYDWDDLDRIIHNYMFKYTNITPDYLFHHRNRVLVTDYFENDGIKTIDGCINLKRNPLTFIVSGRPYSKTEVELIFSKYNDFFFNKHTKHRDFLNDKNFIKYMCEMDIMHCQEGEEAAVKYKFLGDDNWINTLTWSKSFESSINSIDLLTGQPKNLVESTFNPQDVGRFGYPGRFPYGSFVYYYVASSARKHYLNIINNQPINPKYKQCFEVWRTKLQGQVLQLLENHLFLIHDYDLNDYSEVSKYWGGPLVTYSNDQDVYNEVMKALYQLNNNLIRYMDLRNTLLNADLELEDIDSLYAYILSKSSDLRCNKILRFIDKWYLTKITDDLTTINKTSLQRWVNSLKQDVVNGNETYMSDYQVSRFVYNKQTTNYHTCRYIRKRSILDLVRNLPTLSNNIHTVGLNKAYTFAYSGKLVCK